MEAGFSRMNDLTVIQASQVCELTYLPFRDQLATLFTKIVLRVSQNMYLITSKMLRARALFLAMIIAIILRPLQD